MTVVSAVKVPIYWPIGPSSTYGKTQKVVRHRPPPGGRVLGPPAFINECRVTFVDEHTRIIYFLCISPGFHWILQMWSLINGSVIGCPQDALAPAGQRSAAGADMISVEGRRCATVETA